MPQFVAGYLIKLGLTKLIANVIAYVAYYGAVFAAGRAMTRRAGDKYEGMPIEITREPAPARRIIYGRCRVGGPMLFAHLTGTSNKELHIIVAYAGHEVDSIEDTIYVDDETYSRASDGTIGGSLSGYMWSYPHTGFPGQEYDSVLNSFAPTIWTANHDLKGTAYHYHRLKFDQGKWPYGLPNISAIVKGKKCYDPRTTTTVYTDNPALCLRDYLTDTVYGLGAPSARIDDDSVIAAANICDESVSLAGGGTEKRYRCSGVFSSEIEPQQVIESLLATMAGSLFYAGGKWRIHAGGDRAATRAAITESDLAGPISQRTRDSRADTANRVKGQYSSPADNWAPTDFPAVVNSTYLSEDQSEEMWMDLDLTWVFSATQAQRLAKIALERSRQDITVQLKGNLSLLDIQCGDVVPLTISRYGWSAKLFVVVGFALDVAGDGAITIDLELREYASTVWSWSSGEETTFDAAPNTTLPDARTVADPSSLALYSGASYGLTIQPDGTVLSPLVATWTAPADAGVTSGGAIEIQYKTNAGSDWIAAGTLPGDVTRWAINGLKPGVGYDVRIRSVNGIGKVGSWVTVSNHSLAGDTTAPAAPASITAYAPSSYPVSVEKQIALGNNKYTTLTWPESSEADFHYYEFRLVVGNDPTSAQITASKHFRGDARRQISLAGNHAYGSTYAFVRAVDTSGNASDWTGSGSLASSYGEANGDLLNQNASDAYVSAIKTGDAAASSVRQVKARYPFNHFVTLTGGANTENFAIDLTNRGFSAKPDTGALVCIAGDMANVYAVYDYDHASNSSTSAQIQVVRTDGGSITGGSYRFGGELVEYD